MESICIHHWHIDSEDVGQCQKCNEVKDFHELLKEEMKNLKGRAPDILTDLRNSLEGGDPCPGFMNAESSLTDLSLSLR